MSVENADWITDLDPTNPPQGDPIGEGPAHIRLIKGRLVATFPNVTGQVTTSHTNLNNPILSTARTVGGVPIYTDTGADVLVINDFGKSLLSGTAGTIANAIGAAGFVTKAGDSVVTGALTATRFNVANSAMTVTLDGAGNPTFSFLNGTAIAVDLSNGNMNFSIGTQVNMVLDKDGNLNVRGKITGHALG
jgi:hypothetical protein